MPRYSADIVGKLWMGGTAIKSDLPLEAEDDTKAMALVENDGDFQFVIDYLLDRIDICTDCPKEGHAHPFNVRVRDFKSQENKDLFFDILVPREEYEDADN